MKTPNPVMPEFTISYKTKGNQAEQMQVENSQDAADFARFCFESDKIEWVESFVVIALNRENKVLGFYKVSQGGVTGTIADPRVVFQFALLSNASSLILAHNHPSGGTTPSTADKQLTDKLKRAGEALEIKILDHIIVTANNDFYSFADNGNI